MDLAVAIRARLEQLGIEQRQLAVAAEVTESYISQLLTSKKAPPASDRTDIYEKLARVLKLPAPELARIADTQRDEALKRKVLRPPEPLFKEFRRLILRKAVRGKRQQITNIFDREPFGQFERFITQKLLDVSKSAARGQLTDEKWIQRVAKAAGQSYQCARVSLLEFLDTDISHVSLENCLTVLDPLIESWDVDFETFGILVVLNRRLTRAYTRKLEYKEVEAEESAALEPGLQQFLADPKLCLDITPNEVAFLKTLRFSWKRPTPLYYYRELQNLRDPLHFAPASAATNGAGLKSLRAPRRKPGKSSPLLSERNGAHR